LISVPVNTRGPHTGDDLREYLSRRLTQTLGEPGRTGSGHMVWTCRYGDEPALVTIVAREGGTLALRLLQAPDGSSVEVCAVKYLDVPGRAEGDRAVEQLTRDTPP
jgi:hypothetical protein